MVNSKQPPGNSNSAALVFSQRPWRLARYLLLIVALLVTTIGSAPLINAAYSPTNTQLSIQAQAQTQSEQKDNSATSEFEELEKEVGSPQSAEKKPVQAAQPRPSANPQGAPTKELVGIPATRVYGQPNFSSSTVNNGGISASSLNLASQAVADNLGGLYIADTANHRVLYYASTTVTTASRVYGQPSFATNTANNGGISANSLNGPLGLVLDSSGGLYVADSANNRILFYPSGIVTASRVYGQPSFTVNTANNGGRSATTLSAPFSVAVDSTDGLYVTDVANNRALFYPSGIVTASRVYGQPNFTTNTANNGGRSASSISAPQGQIAVDSNDGLYVADRGNNRVLYYSNGITTASLVYGQPNFTLGSANTGLTQPTPNTLRDVRGVVPDGQGGLYIADSSNSRILYYSVGITTAKRVYGQADFNSFAVNNPTLAAYTTSFPRMLSVDASGGLYSADFNNSRVLYYPSSPEPTSLTALGNNQTIPVSSFPLTPVAMQVKDTNGNPVSGLNVQFWGPSSGAGWNTTFYSATTNSNGVAAAPFIANGLEGSYVVTATMAGYPALGVLTYTLTNLTTVTTPTCLTYSSGSSVSIPTTGTATPYPAPLTVAGFAGSVGKLTVTLNPFAHSFASDVTILLVDPSGTRNSILLGQVGGGNSTMVTATLTLDDQALVGLTSSALVTGTYKPSIFLGTTALPAPAPVAYSLGLSNFTGLNPNGTWNLYAIDNVTGDGGTIANWNIKLCQYPASLAASLGSNQTTTLSSAFGSPLVALVKDSSGVVVSNTDITFTAPTSGASGAFAGGSLIYTGTTDANGLVTTTLFTANNVAGSYSVTARSGAFPDIGIANFVLTNSLVAPVLDHFQVAGYPSPSVVGSTNTFTVTAKDSSDATLTNYTGTVTFSSTDPAASLAGNYTFSLADAGVKTFTATLNTLGVQAITATDTVSSSVKGSQTGIIVTVGQPASISTVSGSGQSATVNTNFANPLVAVVRDASSNPVSGAVVTFTASANGAGATFAGATTLYTGTTNASGQVTTSALLANSIAGSYNVTATTSGVAAPAIFGLTNNPGPAASVVVVSGSGQSTLVNTAFSQPLVVSVTDAANNPVSGITVTFAAPGSGASGTFAGGTAFFTGTTNAQGVVTSSVFTANAISGVYSVTATAAGVAQPAIFSLTNNAGCNPLVVTSTGDGLACGTLRQAAAVATSGQVISITLSPGSVITVGSKITLPAGVTVTTPCGANGPVVTVLSTSANGTLQPTGNNLIEGLWFKGPASFLVFNQGQGKTSLNCVRVTKS